MSPTAPKAPLSIPTKLAYGAGDMGAGLTANLVVFSFLIFLTNVAGLSPALAGTVLLLGKVWDSISDPMVGFLSDRTRSRWGRRHVWMLFGSVPFGVSFALMWIVPGFEQTWLKFAYYLVVSILFFTSYTAVNLPYAALTPELTQDYDERTTLSSFRLAFSLGGAVSGLALGAILSSLITNPQRQFQLLGLIGAIAAVLPLYWCIWGTRHRVQPQAALSTDQAADQAADQSADQSTDKGAAPAAVAMPFWEQIPIAFQNRPFLFVIGIYLTSWLALQITATIIPFYAVSWIGLESYFLVALAVQGTAIPMLFVCSLISRRLGKRGLYFLGMGSWIIIQIGLMLVQPGQVGLLYGLAIAASFGVATAYVVPWSMLPDVIELDELQTGQRREGVFYSFMTLLQKVGLAVGIFLVGQALELAGFIPATPGEPIPVQPESALFAIRAAIGPFPTLCLILGLVLAYFYPLTREVHEEIMLKLRERKAAE
ncbi:MAG: MFS transporter [Elainellaceae cyanobacterium]